MHIVPLFSTIVTTIFTIAVFSRYLHRRGPHLLMWSIGLLLYGFGTLTEYLLGFGFSGFALEVWYLSGAMLTAAWLGMGTIHLLVRRGNLAWYITAGLGLLTVAAMALVFSAPLTNTSAFQPSLPVSTQYKDILTRSSLITFLTIILNIFGTIAMVGGAIYSGFLFWRKRILLNRVAGNVLIAIGAFSPAMAGSLVKLGLADMLYVSELIGVILMYVGFVLATSKKPAVNPITAAAQME